MASKDELLKTIGAQVDADSREIRDFFVRMLRIKAVNPRMGGGGEAERARFIEGFMRDEGFQVKRVDVKDDGAPGGIRPNISAKLEGTDHTRTLWYVAHMDTVPEGSSALWESDPFEPVLKEGKIIARGAEDNGQSLVAALFALRALKKLGLKPPFDVGVWCVADEEFASNYGIKHLLDEGLFGRRDLVVVPDSGSPRGTDIEVAEKSLLWLRVTTKGKQVHASLPRKGVNAHRAGMKMTLELDRMLNEKYAARDELYDEPLSTFEPTKKDANVPNVNTVPGEDVSYFDCRVLPRYSLDEMLADIRERCEEHARELGVSVSVEVVEKESAGPATSEESEIATMLARAIGAVMEVTPRFVGIGGQTVGNLFRREGIPTVVWSTIDDVPHEPNEYSRVANLLNDTKVFALLPVLSAS